ncbi:MAG: pentapeptide repeat-containing protein [Candidatus Binataceae bacterium]
MSKKRSVQEIDECSRGTEGSCSEAKLHQIFTPSEKDMLFGTVFRDSELNRVDFSHANLRETEFLNASLNAADFSGADLRGASFIGCDLREACFDQAVMSHTRFDNSWLIGVRGLSEQMSDYVRRHGGMLWFS